MLTSCANAPLPEAGGKYAVWGGHMNSPYGEVMFDLHAFVSPTYFNGYLMRDGVVAGRLHGPREGDAISLMIIFDNGSEYIGRGKLTDGKLTFDFGPGAKGYFTSSGGGGGGGSGSSSGSTPGLYGD
ncbi:MAG: hypothetical protein AB7S36_00395 [Planctomycetota bacterium]